ncbi:MAG: hypothetical protein AABX65_00695 [Nanoarchaeota archaeon]
MAIKLVRYTHRWLVIPLLVVGIAFALAGRAEIGGIFVLLASLVAGLQFLLVPIDWGYRTMKVFHLHFKNQNEKTIFIAGFIALLSAFYVLAFPLSVLALAIMVIILQGMKRK